MLRSLVVPLEEEIGALKDKLRSTDEQLHVYEAAFSGLVRGLGSGSLGDAIRGKSPAEVLGHLDDKVPKSGPCFGSRSCHPYRLERRTSRVVRMNFLILVSNNKLFDIRIEMNRNIHTFQSLQPRRVSPFKCISQRACEHCKEATPAELDGKGFGGISFSRYKSALNGANLPRLRRSIC